MRERELKNQSSLQWIRYLVVANRETLVSLFSSTCCHYLGQSRNWRIDLSMSGTFRSALGFEWLRAWSQVQSFPALRRFTTLRLNDIVTFTHLGIRMTHWTLERTILALYLNTNCSVRKKRQERRFYCTFFSLRSNDLRSLFSCRSLSAIF